MVAALLRTEVSADTAQRLGALISLERVGGRHPVPLERRAGYRAAAEAVLH
jgi:hypothetical protein